MPRLSQPIEYNQFIGGLNTDVSPINNQPNTSLEEVNYILNNDGSRRRRPGMDYETFFVKNLTSITASGTNTASTTFQWKNAGGIPTQTLLVIQIGNEIKIYDPSNTPISGALIYTHVFTNAPTNQNFSYAVVDGLLVIATGDKTPSVLTFANPNIITLSTTTLYIRDFFGVADTISSVDLFDGLNVTVRPTSTSDQHNYNLRNQTFGVPRLKPGAATVTTDPISDFFASTVTKYPSNSDSVNEVLYADTSSAGNKTTDRFWADNLRDNPLGTERAPTGYFIIDALTRGVSRLTKVQANNTQYSTLGNTVTSLPTDTTPGGPTVVAEFAGRVFYAGFSGDLTGGDALSPHMSSYVLFSQIVNNINDIGRCYQVGDPTSKTTPDLVDTDGGYLRLNGAYGIKAMINVGPTLLVFATNGIWSIDGGNNYGFTATSYKIGKVSDRGINSSDSLVLVDNSVMFWGSDGIYNIHTGQLGDWVADNISYGRIQTLFNNIDSNNRDNASGVYDSYDKKVRWIYYDIIGDTTQTKELILDVGLKAFYVNSIGQLGAGLVPRVIGFIKTTPYLYNSIARETQYLVLTSFSSYIEYTFGSYHDATFTDWISEDGIGVDAAAYMVTSFIARDVTFRISKYSEREDYQRDKAVPYLTVHMNRTESGFYADVNGDLQPLTPSSCLVQARWDWSDSSNSNRWGNQFQVYRYRRMYMPSGVSDPYDNGFSTIFTKSRLRGHGKVLSIKFSTEPQKDCHIYGWSLILTEEFGV